MTRRRTTVETYDTAAICLLLAIIAFITGQSVMSNIAFHHAHVAHGFVIVVGLDLVWLVSLAMAYRAWRSVQRRREETIRAQQNTQRSTTNRWSDDQLRKARARKALQTAWPS